MLTLTLVLPLGQPTPGTEFAYVLSARDGEVAAHGVAPLATLGRWSLSFYMLHQPVLIGTLWLVLMLRR